MSSHPNVRAIQDLPVASRATLAAGRLWATSAAPYLAHAVLALRPVVVTESVAGSDLSSFPVDRTWNLYIDPEILAQVSPAEVGFWHLHQVAHLLRRHDRRCPLASTGSGGAAGRTEPEQWWNQACDAEADDDLIPDLLARGLAVPARAVMPADLAEPAGQLAETYFRRQAQSVRDLPAQVADCGSGVDGHPRPWETGSAALSELECSLLSADTARRILEGSRNRGDTPGGWQRWATELLNPTIDWRQQLASAVRRGLAVAAGRVDYSYHRPSRRAAAVPDVVLPTMRRPIPRVAVVVDTSGSVSDVMLGQALAEVAALMRRVGHGRGPGAVQLIACDAQAQRAQRVLDIRQVQLLGGGGTDMGAGLTAAADLRLPPDVVVVLTDGHTPWPQAPPHHWKVVVALLDPAGRCPAWATRVLVQTEMQGEPR